VSLDSLTVPTSTRQTVERHQDRRRPIGLGPRSFTTINVLCLRVTGIACGVDDESTEDWSSSVEQIRQGC